MNKLIVISFLFLFVVNNSSAKSVCDTSYEGAELVSEQEFNKISAYIVNDDDHKILQLLNCGLNINAVADTRSNNNFLIVAIRNNKIKLMKLLLEKGHYVDKRDGNYETPLFVAIEKENKLAIRILIENGADTKAINKYGESITGLARQKGIDLSQIRQETNKKTTLDITIPKFKDFLVPKTYKSENKKLILNKFGKLFRTRLNRAIVESKPEFSGKYLVVRWGCGSGGCNTGAIIDASTGEAFSFPVAMSSVWPVKPEFSEKEAQELIYKLDSRLIIFAGNIEIGAKSYLDSVLFYEFTGSEFKLLKVLPYGKSVESIEEKPVSQTQSEIIQPPVISNTKNTVVEEKATTLSAAEQIKEAPTNKITPSQARQESSAGGTLRLYLLASLLGLFAFRLS